MPYKTLTDQKLKCNFSYICVCVCVCEMNHEPNFSQPSPLSLSLSASSPLLSLPVTVQSPHRSTIVMLSNGNYLCQRHPVLKKSLSAFICLSNHTGLVEGN